MSQTSFAYVIQKGTGNRLDWILERRLNGRDVLPSCPSEGSSDVLVGLVVIAHIYTIYLEIEINPKECFNCGLVQMHHSYIS